jgi:voltage-gated potassium channel
MADRAFRETLKELYFGSSPGAVRFRYALLGFDLLTIAFFIASSMADQSLGILVIDLVLAAILAGELAARVSIANRPWLQLTRFQSIADITVIASLLAPFVLDNLAFLRVVRMLRLLRSYHVLRELRQSSPWFKRNEETLQAILNIVVFVFVLTAVVYVVEEHRNPKIETYVDALYFTVTTLTTTGFGDITPSGTSGKILAIIIMVFGVSLFIRLIQTIFRPTRVLHPCPACGLKRHDPDAVHCKHCGIVLNIPDEG